MVVVLLTLPEVAVMVTSYATRFAPQAESSITPASSTAAGANRRVRAVTLRRTKTSNPVASSPNKPSSKRLNGPGVNTGTPVPIFFAWVMVSVEVAGSRGRRNRRRTERAGYARWQG